MSKRLYNVYVQLILLLLLSSFLYKYTSVIHLNTILGFALIVDMLLIYMYHLTKKDVIVLLFVFLTSVLALINSGDLSITFEHIVYFVNTILVMWKIAESGNVSVNLVDSMDKYCKSAKKIIYCLSLLTLVTLFMSDCYSKVTGVKVYVGLSYSEHAVATNICLLMACLLYYRKSINKRIVTIIYLILSFTMLQSGARAYLVPMIIILFIYYRLEYSNLAIKYILLPLAVILFVYFLSNSALIEKTTVKSANEYISTKLIEAFTSGRTIWWTLDLKKYLQFSFLEKFFGAGHDFVYNYNYQVYGMKIWAHNDFIQILLALGIFGLLGYLYVLYRFIVQSKYLGKGTSIIFPGICITIYIFIMAFFNGYYIANQYVLSTIIILLVYQKEQIRSENL